MSTQRIWTAIEEDGDTFDLGYDFGLLEALTNAANVATESDDEASHYVELEDGRAVIGVDVVRETLSDESVVCKIVLRLARAV